MCNMELTVEYLDLAIPKVDRKVTKVDQFTDKCYFTNQFRHNMHSDNPQQNTIIDTLIALGLNLEKQSKDLTEIHNSIYENTIFKRNRLQELFHNIEYIKNQSNDIVKIISQRRIVL